MKQSTKLAFERGFIKAALESGVNPSMAHSLFGNLNLNDLFHDHLGIVDPNKLNTLRDQIALDTTTNGIHGAIGGGLAGGLAGYFMGKNKQHPEADHSIRDAIAMGALGIGAGGLGGATYGLSNSGHRINDYIAEHPYIFSAPNKN